MAKVGACDKKNPPVWTVLPPHDFRHPQELYKITVEKPHPYPHPDTKQSKKPFLSRLRKRLSKACQRRAMTLMIALVALLLSIVVAVGVALYLTVGEVRWEEEEADMLTLEAETGSRAVDGEFRITNRPYSTELVDRTSRTYIRLAAQVLQSLDELFLQSYLVRDYNTTKIARISDNNREDGVRLNVQVIFNRSFPNLAQQVGLIMIQALERGHGTLPAGTLHIDIRSIRFVALRNDVEEIPPEKESFTDAGWSPWSEWSSCVGVMGECEPWRGQSRSRSCRSAWGQGQRLPSVEPCMSAGGGRELEIRDCYCKSSKPIIPPTSTTTTHKPSVMDDVMLGDSHPGARKRPCSQCHLEELCLIETGASEGTCVWPKTRDDPRGCGGWCAEEHELCRSVAPNTFQCVDDSVVECLPEEWRCGNGLCIPSMRRCDGHFNCYDMTDEYDCGKCDGFQCGNKTSCLDLSRRCDGEVECWDGSDEANCTKSCDASQFTCNSGHCVGKDLFCDGFADCEDESDEPSGCDSPCLPSQFQCGNKRCVDAKLVCDGSDQCGDNTDELKCATTPRLPVVTQDSDRYQPPPPSS